MDVIERDETSIDLLQRMHGCFDALQKKYLRTVRLSIYTDPENPQKVTECYQFKIQYTEQGPQMDFESNSNKRVSKMSCSNTKKASILLVRKLYTLMQYLGPLPDSVCLSMTLSYYDDVTPQQYQPPGFKEGPSDGITFEKEGVKLTMGEVVTPFHTLKVDVTTERERLEREKKPDAQEPLKEKKEAKSTNDKALSQMEFPLSQDPQPSHPKKRKFSEPKDF